MSRRRLSVVGGTLVSAATLVLAVLWVQAPSPTASTPAPPDAVARPAPPALASPPLADFAAIVQRPLFAPDRRPPQPPPPAAAAPVRTPPFTLHGVILSEHRQVAFLKPSTRGPVVRAEPGDRVAGWLVVAVQPRAVALRNGTIDVLLPLAEPGGAARR